MALPKAVGYFVVLLGLNYCLGKTGHSQSLNVFSEDVMDTKALHIHAREIRIASLDESTVDIDVVLELNMTVQSVRANFIDQLRTILKNISLDHTVSNFSTYGVKQINFNNGCSPISGQCQCEEQFAQSCDRCDFYDSCSNATTSCDCIKGLPTDGESCEPIASITQCPTPTPVSVEFDVVLEFQLPIVRVRENAIDQLREILQNISLNNIVSTLSTVRAVDFDFTTGCSLISNVSQQCQCEEQFAWSCDKCDSYGSCSNATTSCDCIKGRPDGKFCEPIASITQCPTPTPVSVEFDVVLEFQLPILRVRENAIDQLREILQNISLNNIVSTLSTVRAVDFDFTTGCSLISNVSQQCQCEEQFAWSCDKCNFYGSCSNATTSCDCIKGRPDGKFCEPIASITPCPTPTPVTKPTTTTPPTTTMITTPMKTTPMPTTPPPTPVITTPMKTTPMPTTPPLTPACPTCALPQFTGLLDDSENLTDASLPRVLSQLNMFTNDLTPAVVESTATISVIVNILTNVANALANLKPLTNESFKDILSTVGILTTDAARASWDTLNDETRNVAGIRTKVSAHPFTKVNQSVSSSLLASLENITRSLSNNSFDIATPFILFNQTTFTDTFTADFDSSVVIDIPQTDARSISVMTFASMDNVLLARDKDNSSSTVINGRVVLVRTRGAVTNISFTFDVINTTLVDPQCVFWNFDLFDGRGGWDDQGCVLVDNVNQTVTCNCNHTTSFSILLSPYSPKDPVLDYITYIGVGISMASLVICLIIEAVIWRSISRNTTSYLRHVSIVNIAMSLLIANIWFIIGASISDFSEKKTPACTAATFFIHFFYLALFFWMLCSGLLLFYRTVSVFDGGLSRKSMLAIGFSLGYGAPLIIAAITIAVTLPNGQYTRAQGICWLAWEDSMALLAFVIPVLSIVAINLLILILVIYKLLRRRAVTDSAQGAERHVLLVIARSLAVLTPFFGLTWALGVGILISPRDRGIHIAFTFFNSLQGFFILVFGTLLDKKVRSELGMASQTSSSSGTRSTSAGNSSSAFIDFFRNLGKGRAGFNTSSPGTASGASHSYTNS